MRNKVSARFVDQGEQSVKNIAHPVRAFRVQAVAPLRHSRSAAGAPGERASDKPSIVVLPFVNMSDVPSRSSSPTG